MLASFDAKVEHVYGNKPYCFKICDDLYHVASSDLELIGDARELNVRGNFIVCDRQYVHDSNEAVEFRMGYVMDRVCHAEVMLTI